MGEARRPSQIIAARTGEIRTRLGWSQASLAGRLQELGEPIDRTIIAKIESGKRKITVDEFFALAAALGVAPIHLIVPLKDRDSVQLTRKLAVRARDVRRWVRGLQAIRGSIPRRSERIPLPHNQGYRVDYYRTFREERPEAERVARQNSGIQMVETFLDNAINSSTPLNEEGLLVAAETIYRGLHHQAFVRGKGPEKWEEYARRWGDEAWAEWKKGATDGTR